MDYRQENRQDLSNYIDCYWESHDMEGEKLYTYPSLPEPYINFYFPLQAKEKAKVKGLSSQADFFEMRAKLFGVRFYLRGYYQLKLSPISTISNRIVGLEEIGRDQEQELAQNISKAQTFETRVELFQSYLMEKIAPNLTKKEENISTAFQYLISEYKDPKVIQHYSEKSGFSPRTITRWFSGEIGITPKKLCRIARFHRALFGLHSNKEPGFYFDCGYFDQSHFIREFKEFTGITPEEYLKIVSDLYN